MAVGGERFGFGENWARFNASVTDEQRDLAKRSLVEWLGDLRGMSFVDVGAGSGLFSEAAAALGADVTAFDYDPSSPRILRGDILDPVFVDQLGTFDVVYSWGVLHHTGMMWNAIQNAAALVKPRGRLFISIYNDDGKRTRRWWKKKRLFNRLPKKFRPIYAAFAIAPWELRRAAKLTLQRKSYFSEWRRPRDRGMSKWRDIVDWVGGFPFEYATADEVVAFCEQLGFTAERVNRRGGLGCNEFLFRRNPKRLA